MIRSIFVRCMFACATLPACLSFANAKSGSSLILSQYPIRGAQQVVRETEIGLHARSAVARSFESDYFSVVGSRSGIHKVTPRIARDGRTLILHPDAPFGYSETVTVACRVQLIGGLFASDTFSFTTKGYSASHGVAYDAEIEQAAKAKASASMNLLSDADSLPAITIKVDHGAYPGNIYLANFGVIKLPNADYLMVTDEHGRVKQERKLSPHYACDFKVQPTGLITYYDFVAGKFYGMDSSWTIIDSFEVATGYIGDAHELRVFEDGSYALLADELLSIDMTAKISGGMSDATVTSNCIQIFDRDHNMLMNWRGYDHYNITDAKFEALTLGRIDYEHANALDFDSSGNILMSNRHLSELTFINGENGDIIWRLGGAHNQFTLANDSIWFSYQHACRILPNGHITIFDNSNFDTVIGSQYWMHKSRAAEYVLDTAKMTTTLVWQFHHDPETYGGFMGYTQRLPNGNTLISWGGDDSVAVTEVAPDNSTVFEMAMTPGNYSYRAIKFPRDTTQTVQNASVSSDPQSSAFWLEPNVDGSSTLHYSTDVAGQCDVSLYDVLGRKLKTISSSIVAAGVHRLSIDTHALTNAAFFIVLEIPGERHVLRMQP